MRAGRRVGHGVGTCGSDSRCFRIEMHRSSAAMAASTDITADSDDVLVHDCARHIVDAFGFYNAEFRVITRRAPVRFETRDWKGSQRDAVERIDLYDRFVNQTIAELRLQLGERALDRALWARIRDEFAA